MDKYLCPKCLEFFNVQERPHKEWSLKQDDMSWTEASEQPFCPEPTCGETLMFIDTLENVYEGV